MEVIYEERYPWSLGQTFEIRILHEVKGFVVAVNWIRNTTGEEESINLRYFNYPLDSNLDDMVEKAKAFISTVKTIDDQGNVNK